MRNYTQLHYEFSKWKHIVNNINRYHTRTPLLDLLWDNKSLLEYDVPKDELFFRPNREPFAPFPRLNSTV